MGTAMVQTVVLLAAAAQLVPTTSYPTPMPLYMERGLKLLRAHKNKLLVETSCAQYCKNVVWQYKKAGDKTWMWADALAPSIFPQYFFVRGLRPDTLYVLRALLKPSSGSAYMGDEIPTLEARTCPVVTGMHSCGAQVRVSRLDESPEALSPSRSLVVRADTACIANNSCGVIGAAPTNEVTTTPTTLAAVKTTKPTTTPPTTRTTLPTPPLTTPMPTTLPTSTPTSTAVPMPTPTPTPTPTPSPSPMPPDDLGDAEGSELPRRAECDEWPAGNNTFGRLAPLFLALALLAFAAVPAAFFWGRKKRWVASEEVAQHLMPVWKRQLGNGGSDPVLTEDGSEPDGLIINTKPSALL